MLGALKISVSSYSLVQRVTIAALVRPQSYVMVRAL